MKNKKILIVGIIVVVILGIWLSNSNEPKLADSIKIGFIGPLTGEAAPYGTPVKEGIELALKDAVKSGLFKEGQIEIIYEDAKCEAAQATLAAQKLINIDKVEVIFGGQCSGETLAIAPIVEQSKVLLISSFSTSPDVTNAGDYVFRVPASDANSGKVMASLIVKDGFKNIGLVSEKTIAAQTIIPVFEEALGNNGGNIAYKESFSSESNEFMTVATKIKQANPEALYMNVQTGAAGSRMTKALKDLGYNGQIYTFFITGDDFVKSGNWVNGVKILDYRAAKSDKDLAEFMEKFVAEYKKEPAYSFGATLGYDTGAIIFEAINKVGNDADAIKDYLYQMKTRPSITGNLTFDQNGDPLGNDVYFVRQVVNNELVDL